MFSTIEARASRAVPAILLSIYLSGCADMGRTHDCQIAAPTTSKVNSEITRKVGADLSAFVKAPIKGNLESTVKETVDRTFQQVGEANTACHMLLRTAQCFSRQPNGEALAKQVLTYITNGRQCEQHTGSRGPGSADEWIGVGNTSVEPKPQHDEEAVQLNFKDGLVFGKSVFGDFTWEQHGFLRDGHLVLAYRTQEHTGRGFGLYFLKDQEGLGNIFVGYREGRSCRLEKIVKCPYVLIKGRRDSKEVKAAKQQYSDVLNQRCIVTDPAVCK